MAKITNNVSGFSQLLRAKTNSKSGLGTNLSSQSSGDGTTRNLRPSSGGEMKSLGFGSGTFARGLSFGRASAGASSVKNTSGNELSTLLRQTASGGLASTLGGSFGLGSISGIGSIIAGISSLFGGGTKSVAPLTKFELPAVQNATVYVSKENTPNSQGEPPSGMYSVQTEESGPGVQWIQDNAIHIAQAVRSALLNSSSLHDVIAEI